MTEPVVSAVRVAEEWRPIYRDAVDYDRTRVDQAQAALNDAERQRRLNAAIAVHYGAGKTEIANRLGVSRPTLDRWLAQVADTPDEAAQLQLTLDLNRRRLERDLNGRQAQTPPPA
jgi:hypothetical protein